MECFCISELVCMLLTLCAPPPLKVLKTLNYIHDNLGLVNI